MHIVFWQFNNALFFMTKNRRGSQPINNNIEQTMDDVIKSLGLINPTVEFLS